MRPVFQGELAEGLQGANGVQQHVVAVGLHRGHLVGHGGDIPHGAADEGVEQTTHRYEEQRISGVDEDHHERGQRQHEEREHEAVTHHGDGHDDGVDVLGQARDDVAGAQFHDGGHGGAEGGIQR